MKILKFNIQKCWNIAETQSHIIIFPFNFVEGDFGFSCLRALSAPLEVRWLFAFRSPLFKMLQLQVVKRTTLSLILSHFFTTFIFYRIYKLSCTKSIVHIALSDTTQKINYNTWNEVQLHSDPELFAMSHYSIWAIWWPICLM